MSDDNELKEMADAFAKRRLDERVGRGAIATKSQLKRFQIERAALVAFADSLQT